MADLAASLRRKVLGNWVKLFTGSTLGSALGMLSLIIMSRSISVFDVGVISVLQTYWRTLEGFFSFQSFQALIKFGAEALHAEDSRSFRAIVKICMMADAGVAALGGGVGAIGYGLFHDRMNIPDSLVLLGLWGLVTMLSMIAGAPLGVLRLFDRFALVAARDVIVGILRVLASAMGLLFGLSVEYFFAIWVVTETAGNLIIIICGFVELRRRGFGNPLTQKLGPDIAVRPRQIVRSLLTINVGTMIRISTEEGDVLLVNALTGPIGAGKYRVAKTLASIIYRFAGPLQQSIYPEIARLLSENRRDILKKTMLETNLMGASIGFIAFLAWVLLGNILMHFTVGDQYVDALPSIEVITFGYSLGFFGISNNIAMFCFGKLRTYLVSTIFCTVWFFIVSFGLIPQVGFVGAAWGQFACYGSGMLFSFFVVRRAIARHDWRQEDQPISGGRAEPYGVTE